MYLSFENSMVETGSFAQFSLFRQGGMLALCMHVALHVTMVFTVTICCIIE